MNSLSRASTYSANASNVATARIIDSDLACPGIQNDELAITESTHGFDAKELVPRVVLWSGADIEDGCARHGPTRCSGERSLIVLMDLDAC
jgi:hypothetical protein